MITEGMSECGHKNMKKNALKKESNSSVLLYNANRLCMYTEENNHKNRDRAKSACDVSLTSLMEH